MTWRSIIAGLACSLLPAVAGAVEKPYRVSLVGDSHDGKAWTTGIRIEMDEGWKTYWRMPGEAGIPPDFTWKSSVPANIEVLYPVPHRSTDASGEAVGYQREVIFPVIVNAGMAKEVTLDLGMFFGVCREVCIPAQAEVRISLSSAVNDPQGVVQVAEAMKRVPRPGNLVAAANVALEDGKPVLHLKLDDAVDDIFVETSSTAYFRAPEFTEGNRQARLVIGNAGGLAALEGTTLKLTLSRGGLGLEQSVTLP